MRKIFCSFYFLFFGHFLLWASEGEVMVLNAPLLKEAKTNAIVTQFVRKGDLVYIPKESTLLSPPPEFFETYDRAGNSVFIASRNVKVITNDEIEFRTPISNFSNDSTDYRLEEPISKTYPFADSKYLKSTTLITLGPGEYANYQYPEALKSQAIGTEWGLQVFLLRKVSFDAFDRFYFGITSAFTMQSNNVHFINNSPLAKEDHYKLRFGPILTFDIYSTPEYRLSTGGGFTYNYHTSTIQGQQMNGYSLAPLFTAYWQILEIFPRIDFALGNEINAYLPHHLNGQKMPLTFQNSWIFGFQTRL